MMDETLKFLRYACKLEIISRRDIERMLQSLGTPAPEDNPPTRLLVDRGLLSQGTLDSLWDDTKLIESLENGVLEPDDVDAFRALREIHSDPKLRQELLDTHTGEELSPIQEEEMGEAETVFGDALQTFQIDDIDDQATMVFDEPPAPIQADDIGEQATMVFDEPPTPIQADDIGEQATMVFDEPPTPMQADDIGEQATMVFDEPPTPMQADDIGEQATMVFDEPPAPIQADDIGEQATMVFDELEAVHEDVVGESPTIIESVGDTPAELEAQDPREAATVVQDEPLSPIDSDADPREAATVVQDDPLSPIDNDLDPREATTLVQDDPPSPIDNDLDPREAATLVQDDPLSPIDNDLDPREAATLVQDDPLSPIASDVDPREAATLVQDDPLSPLHTADSEAKTTAQKTAPSEVTPPDDTFDEQATLIYDETDATVQEALAAVEVSKTPEGQTADGVNPDTAEELSALSAAEPPSSDTSAIQFEPDPTISQYKTRQTVTKQPAEPDSVAAPEPAPVTATPVVETPRPSKLPLIALVIITLLLGSRVAQLEIERRKKPSATETSEERRNGDKQSPGTTSGNQQPTTRLSDRQRATIILREAERIVPRVNEDSREVLFELTMRWFQRGLVAGGKTAGDYRQLGRHLIMRWGEYQQALASLTNANKQDPETLWSRAFARDRLVHLKARNKALAQLASTTTPYAAAARAELARIDGKLDQALAAYGKLSGAALQDPLVQLKYGRLLRRTGRTAASKKLLDKLLEAHPNFLAAQIEVALMMSDSSAMGARLVKIEGKVRHDPFCQVALAIAQRKQGNLKASAKRLRRLLKEGSGAEFALGHIELARTLLLQGKKIDAAAAAAAAVKLDPSLKSTAAKLLKS